MKNDNILYVNGCSYAYGQGVHKLESICKEQRFSRTLSDHLGFVEVNKALPGSSNSRIARRTLVDLIHHKPKLAIIIWSDPSRIEFKNGPLYYDDIKYHYDLNQFRVNSKNCSREVKMYYQSLSTPQHDLLDTLYHMLSVKILADSMNIPCIQFHFREGFVNDLNHALNYKHIHYRSTLFEYINILASDDLVYGLRPNEMFSFQKIGGGYIDHTGHPNKTSHDNVVKWLIQLIESRSIL